MLKKIKPYMMPIAMIIGSLFFPFFCQFDFLMPYLIILMLFFPFCGMALHEIHFSKMHLSLILIQVFGSVSLYFLLAPFDVTLAQSGFICLFAPTATSAVVITGMLKGNTMSLTAYTLLSNLMVVFLAPVLFSSFGANRELPFWDSSLMIGQRISLLLLTPLVSALLLRYFLPSIARRIQKKAVFSYYLWVLALIIVTASTVKFIFLQGGRNYALELGMASLALVACVGQFLVGKTIGGHFLDRIAGGQALGQKNTILAIWLAQTYLDPLASIGPGAYILWQNIVNSWQVWRMRQEL